MQEINEVFVEEIFQKMIDMVSAILNGAILTIK